MQIPDIRALYYITHIDNLPSIFEHGIFSHDRVEAENLSYKSISDAGILRHRSNKPPMDGKNLWDFANLYFQPRNAMMYRIVNQRNLEDIAVVSIDKTVLDEQGVFLTDGNAASTQTQFYRVPEGLKTLRKQWQIIQEKWWNDVDGSKRKMMAECLIPNYVKPEYIQTVYVAKNETQNVVQQIVGNRNFLVIAEPDMFFQPNRQVEIGSNLSIIEGDMFFSRLQTLTISVNLQGIMGKGLASRAKYQFPDVYVAYQDACRSKRVTAIKPYLYKREGSFDEELAYDFTSLSTPNAMKWFLLFATKRRWRENSRFEDIEGGLDWVRRNFQQQGIQSLAMPALGCGLGGLDWKDIGPLMCKSLHRIGIPVEIYLPRERSIPQEHLSEAYLLDS